MPKRFIWKTVFLFRYSWKTELNGEGFPIRQLSCDGSIDKNTRGQFLMAILYKNLRANITNLFPLIILYYLSLSEIDTHFSNMFEILSFNLQIIIVYYWMLRNSSVLGNGHVFFAGIINDVVMGLPLGISSISYLTVSLVASYVRQVTVNISLFTDWFTFLLAIFFSVWFM